MVERFHPSCLHFGLVQIKSGKVKRSSDNESSLCFHKVDDIGSLIEKIYSSILDQFRCDEVHYQIQFLSCSSRTLTKSERRRVLEETKNKIKEGPYFICSVCNRILYRKSVLKVSRIKYSVQHVFTGLTSFDNNEYICRTCHLKVLKGKVLFE